MRYMFFADTYAIVKKYESVKVVIFSIEPHSTLSALGVSGGIFRQIHKHIA